MNQSETSGSETEAAYRAGRRAGLGIAALSLGVVTFVSLLGLEKALLAGTLGVLAIRGSAPGSSPRRMGVAALVLACLFVVLLAVLLLVFRERLTEFLTALDRLS